MKIRSNTLVLPLAVVLLVGAAGVVLATSAPESPAVDPGTSAEPSAAAATEEPSAATATPGPAAASTKPGPTASDKPRPERTDTSLTKALDKLVADGTITAAQKQAILDAVTVEREARLAELKAQRDAKRAELKAKREELKKNWEQLRGFLADGVITKAEFDQLPADSALRKVPSLMADNKITSEELKELGKGLFRGRGHGWFKGDKPAASPSASPATSG